eukprot:5061534-Pleurochrysis_carterae.AAC.1
MTRMPALSAGWLKRTRQRACVYAPACARACISVRAVGISGSRARPRPQARAGVISTRVRVCVGAGGCTQTSAASAEDAPECARAARACVRERAPAACTWRASRG